MPTNLDPRNSTWTNTDMVLVNDDTYTETFAEAIAENGGFAAYLPRMIAAQQDVLTSHGATLTETHQPYVTAGTYDVYVSMRYSTDDSGTYAASLNGTTVYSNPSASGAWKTGSYVDFVIDSSGFCEMNFAVTGDGPGDTGLTCSSMFLRFVDADF